MQGVGEAGIRGGGRDGRGESTGRRRRAPGQAESAKARQTAERGVRGDEGD